MAELFIKQAKQYLEARPNYPQQLFQFIASTTPCRDLAWDVGTGSGQAAKSLVEIYKNVIGTDTSQKQLDFAPKLPNVRYQCTAPNISTAELKRDVATESSLDLVTVAQALHWFDLPAFYQQVKYVLKKPRGVIAAWCYTTPQVNASVDAIMQPFYTVDSNPYWDPARKLVDDKYTHIDFPFEPVDGFDHTGPFEFRTERLMSLDEYFTYLKSWSAYQTAKDKGVELLSDNVIGDFTRAWNEDGNDRKITRKKKWRRKSADSSNRSAHFSAAKIRSLGAIPTLSAVVRKKLQRLQMVPQMNKRVKALCGCLGLWFIPDDQMMCSVG